MSGGTGGEGPDTSGRGYGPAWIAVAGTIVAAVVGAWATLAFSDRGGGHDHDDVTPTASADALVGGTGGGGTESAPPRRVSPSPDPADEPTRTASPSRAPSAKARWTGLVTLPLSLNQASDVGADVDGSSPGRLVGVDDDLRGDFSASASVVVMSGRAAEAPGSATELSRAECVRRLPGGVPTQPVWVPLTRGNSNAVSGTYCFTTTGGRVAAFEMVSASFPLPEKVTVQVVVWD
ncbi:hypothetical protein GCM10010218_08760 [Streptomyces mashuensis]|uniref:Uncharacterized protein n=1 Tax=Streptomyces mashuensis TaxID=33904 RepID=A0A919AYJ9_9ACTN|nr:hypothetical protein [Streptomyces mashuensis]GHF29829.1 hypothetical protein GCM10010218_08760 [Streptomyces mashuensis]